MPFPLSDRVLYKKNPLEVVVCQLRFPPVLRIDAELPHAFQEHVRAEYPFFSERQSVVPEAGVPAGVPPEILKAISEMLPFRASRMYEFTSADSNWRVTLTKETLSLGCKQYRRWEDFKQHLQLPMQFLLKTYAPSFYLRIGLRYRDLIKRSVLKLNDVPWNELLKPPIAGVLGSEIAPAIRQTNQQLLIDLGENNAQVRVQHGFLLKGTEQCYLIDSDFFTSVRKETNDAIATLDYFNRQSGRLFRWCISDRLHGAMEPERLPDPVVQRAT